MDDTPGAEFGGEVAVQSPQSRVQSPQSTVHGPRSAVHSEKCSRRGSEQTESPPGQSSVRSAMFIVQAQQGGQAPSGAACRGRTVHGADVSLLTELGRGIDGPRCYKYAAPNGAARHVAWDKISGLGTAVQLRAYPKSSDSGPLSKPLSKPLSDWPLFDIVRQRFRQRLRQSFHWPGFGDRSSITPRTFPSPFL